MNNRLWILGTAIVVAALAVLGWFLGISPKLDEAALARTDRETVEVQNAAQEAALAVLREQYDNIDELRSELADMQRSIPEGLGDQDVSDAINSLALAHGVGIKSIVFSEAAVFGESAEAAEESAVEAPEGVYMIPVSIEVTGDPVPVLQFSRGLQTLERIFFVSRLVYEPGAGNITGYMYVVRPPGVDLSKYEQVEDGPATEEPTPTDTATPTPEPTETSSP